MDGWKSLLLFLLLFLVLFLIFILDGSQESAVKKMKLGEVLKTGLGQ